MLINPPPMSSAERVRRFRKGNPGYDARMSARRRGSAKRDAAKLRAARIAAAEAEQTMAAARELEKSLGAFDPMI